MLYSLYDYLGRAAGPKLGDEVFKKASMKKIKYSTREIANPKYVGKVIIYPISFLNEYFNRNK